MSYTKSSAEEQAARTWESLSTVAAYTISGWCNRVFPESEPLLFPWLQREARYLIWGERGCGKSTVLLATAFAVATGGRLGTWQAPAPARVVYLDGEMSRKDLKDRLIEFREHFGDPGDDMMLALSTVDLQKYSPLDKKDRAAALLRLVAGWRPDLVILDNIQCLVSSSIKEGAAYDGLQPVMLGIRSLAVTSIWGHHAGFSAEHHYGDSRIDWQMAGSLRVDRILKDEADKARLNLRISIDKPMREVRGDDTLAIPQQIIFSGSSIEAPESPKAGSADAEVIRELIACSGLVTGSVTDLRRVFIERCSPQGSNKDRNKLSMKFLRALTKLQKAGIVELSGSGKDQTWALC